MPLILILPVCYDQTLLSTQISFNVQLAIYEGGSEWLFDEARLTSSN